MVVHAAGLTRRGCLRCIAAAHTTTLRAAHTSPPSHQNPPRRTDGAMAVGGFFRRVITRTSDRMSSLLHAMLPCGLRRHWGSH